MQHTIVICISKRQNSVIFVHHLFMKYFLLVICFCSISYMAVSQHGDTVNIPVNRLYFHDKIKAEQNSFDLSDGKADNFYHSTANDETDVKVSDIIFNQITSLRYSIETNADIPKNNDKIRQLSYVENFLKIIKQSLKERLISAHDIPDIYAHFLKVMVLNLKGEDMSEEMKPVSYPIAKINTAVFFDNKGYANSRNLVYLKYAALHPDKILKSIRPYVNEVYADSLIVLACKYNPVQLYSYAQSKTSPEGKLIHRSENGMVKAVAKLSQTSNALLYFPFLDNLLSEKITIDSIRKFVGDGENGYDSIGYFKLLVKTEIEYFMRMAPPLRDTPIAMFGVNGLRETLRAKAIQHFITPINTLHDVNNLNVRMKAIDPLSPVELYYMLVMGENDIYTSSYKHSFNRMMQRMGTKPRGDSLLQEVHFDYFKKFIKMAANFNKLDTFLKTMPVKSSEVLMKGFVANLDKTGNLEDAVDVADSYSSISDKNLLKTIFNYVVINEERHQQDGNIRGKIIYNLLKTIMMSADTSVNIDLGSTLGIPSVYSVPANDFKDVNGAIVQQVFFYGDEDGKAFFPSFLKSFSPKLWSITTKKEWVEIKALKSNVWVFANRPLDSDENLDDSAQVHLNTYLENNKMLPSVIVHRGHSYWLPRTIHRMSGTAKVVLIGSCGGYQNLNEILQVCPDAHIITTKEIGKGDINQPILNALNQNFFAGTAVDWRILWAALTRQFMKDPKKEVRESWENYIPPYKNLGAIFIKAYNKQAEASNLE